MPRIPADASDERRAQRVEEGKSQEFDTPGLSKMLLT
jgi:hypothetical protein